KTVTRNTERHTVPLIFKERPAKEALMTFNSQILNQVITEAKTKAAGNKRWIAAIDRAVAGLTGEWIVTELQHCLAVTTESVETDFANGSCQCKAFTLGTPCKHRAAARIVEMYNEAQKGTDAMSVPTLTDERTELIADITRIWPKTWPPLYTELLARFGKSN